MIPKIDMMIKPSINCLDIIKEKPTTKHMNDTTCMTCAANNNQNILGIFVVTNAGYLYICFDNKLDCFTCFDTRDKECIVAKLE